MDRKSKYIIVDRELLGGFAAEPYIFSDLVQHQDLANVIPGRIVSAGFCRIVEGRYVCYGESVSLKLKAQEEDSEILNTYLGIK